MITILANCCISNGAYHISFPGFVQSICLEIVNDHYIEEKLLIGINMTNNTDGKI